MTEPTYDECLVDAELRARAAYAEPGRHYHNEEHLDDCLARLEEITDLSGSEERLLRWAVLWHDAVYDPTRSDNEERSAELARQELLGCGASEAAAAELARLILLTKDHRAEEADRLGSIMISIDLAILGSEPECYRTYVRNIREEYAHLSDDEWRTGRTAVLDRLLASDPLYPNPEFRQRLERRARSNMEDELKALGAG